MSIKALFLAGTALAAALPARNLTNIKREDNKPTIWTSPDGGDTQAVFGDGKTYVGSCTPDQIFDSVIENCYSEGFCNSDSWSLQCVQGDLATHTVTISAPEGQYQSWIRNGLVDSMRAGMKTDGVVETETIYAQSGGGCVGCPWTTKSIQVHHVPSSIGIAHANDGTVPDVITLSITNDDDGGSGLCETLTAIGGAVAGSFNGAVGGVFSIAGLACG